MCSSSFCSVAALAMQYLRSHNVAHMDLKPQNILLTSASNPIIKIAGRERERERERSCLLVFVFINYVNVYIFVSGFVLISNFQYFAGSYQQILEKRKKLPSAIGQMHWLLLWLVVVVFFYLFTQIIILRRRRRMRIKKNNKKNVYLVQTDES